MTQVNTAPSDTADGKQGTERPRRAAHQTGAVALGWSVLGIYYLMHLMNSEWAHDRAFWGVVIAVTLWGLGCAFLARNRKLLIASVIAPVWPILAMLLGFVMLVILMFAKAAVNLVAQLITGEMVWPEPMSF